MQFSLRTLLLLTAGVAISVACVAFASKRLWDTEILISMRYLGVRSAQNCPLFVPLIVAAYAIGRRRLNASTIIALVIAEAVALAVQSWAVAYAEYLQTI
jgi:hypothetical protein